MPFISRTQHTMAASIRPKTHNPRSQLYQTNSRTEATLQQSQILTLPAKKPTEDPSRCERVAAHATRVAPGTGHAPDRQLELQRPATEAKVNSVVLCQQGANCRSATAAGCHWRWHCAEREEGEVWTSDEKWIWLLRVFTAKKCSYLLELLRLIDNGQGA